MFVYGPPLLLEGSVGAIGLALASGIVGVTALAAAGVGFGRRILVPWERVLLVFGALALVLPGWQSDLAGLVAVVIGFRGVEAVPDTPDGPATA